MVFEFKLFFNLIFFPNSGGSNGASGSGARKKNLKSHVWNYFSREQTDDPTRIKIHCLICIEKRIVQEPFTMRKGGGTGTLNRHLVEKHGISKESHESGQARGAVSYTHLTLPTIYSV